MLCVHRRYSDLHAWEPQDGQGDKGGQSRAVNVTREARLATHVDRRYSDMHVCQ